MSVDVSIVTSGHDVGDARLHRLVTSLTRAGLAVEVIGTGLRDSAPEDATRVHVERRGGMKRRVLRAVRSPLRAAGRVVMVIDPDAVPAAMLLKARGRRVVVDVHEDYSRLLADRSWARGATGIAARAAVRLITELTARADLTVVADHHVPPLSARNRIVLRNTAFHGHLPGPSQPDATPRALHVGDLRRSRGLFDMVEAIAGAPQWRLDLVGPVSAADEAELLRRLDAPDVAGRVRLYGRRPPRQAWSFATGAWVGLSMLQDTPAFREAIPSKLYEFLACGLPVIGTPLPRQAEIINSTGAGVVVSDVASATAALNAYATEASLLSRHRDAARATSFGDAGDYEAFAARVVAIARNS